MKKDSTVVFLYVSIMPSVLNPELSTCNVMPCCVFVSGRMCEFDGTGAW